MISIDRLKEVFEYREDGELIRLIGHKYLLNKPAGGVTGSGYKVVSIDNKQYLLHRLIWLYHHGYLPEAIDHKDGNKLNNKIENLRPANKSLNEANTGLRRNNTSGYKGVNFVLKRNTWRVRIQDRTIGYYDSAEKAAKAYNEEALKIYNEYAFLNIIKENN